MNNQLKDYLKTGAVGIDILCKNCMNHNFVSTGSFAANVICQHCGKPLELTKANKEYLCAMVALINNLG